MFLLLWMDEIFIRNCRWYICTKERMCECNWKWRARCVSVTILQTVKAASIGLLWVVSELMDGDWYVCCQNGLSGPQAQIPCKEKSNRTIEEQALIDNLKNQSNILGLSLLLVFLFLALLYSSVRWMKCCSESCKNFSKKLSKKCCKEVSEKCSCSIDYGTDFYELIVIKEENSLNEALKKVTKDDFEQKIKDILNQDNRDKYFKGFEDDEELIEKLWQQENQNTGTSAGPSGQPTSNQATKLKPKSRAEERKPLTGGPV